MSNLPTVFISYTRSDSAFADRLEAELSKYGFSTWMDRQHLEGGQDWATVIEDQIQRHDGVVVVLSPDSVISKWVRREIAYADQFGKFIVPVLAQKTRVPFRISELQYIDCTQDFVSGIVQLRTALLSAHPLPTLPKTPQPAYSPPEPIIQEPLVDIVQPPAAPDANLELLYMQARSALAKQDWDTAEALLQQAVARDSDYDSGAAQSDLEMVRRKLLPIQMSRLQNKADAAHYAGQWGEEIACWNAILRLAPGNKDAELRLNIAEQNQQAQQLYKRALTFADVGDMVAALSESQRLRERAPYYGDPEGLGAKIGMELSPNYLDIEKNEAEKRRCFEAEANLKRMEFQKRSRMWTTISGIGFAISAIFILGIVALLTFAGWGWRITEQNLVLPIMSAVCIVSLMFSLGAVIASEINILRGGLRKRQ